ncbi:MAG: hypothetical protein K2I23_02330, partial [Clostridia bacterium]|nr:hypothetical protein [Clostridia bacterium]
YKGQIHPEYEYFDKNGNKVDPKDLVDGEDYTVKVKIPDSEKDKFDFVDKDGNSVELDKVPSYEFEKKPASSSTPPTTDGTFDKILEKLKDLPLWQLIASAISTILTLVFLGKTAGYASKRKKFNKKAEKLENTSSVFAGAFLGMAAASWTVIACVLMGVAVFSLVMMIIAKKMCSSAEEEYEEKKQEFDRNKSEMMYMRMMGGQAGNMGQGIPQGMPQGAYMGGGYGIGIDDMRGLITETVTALLPGVQQLLPQQASTNDEVVQRLIDENARSQETIHELMQKLAEQPAEREVASSANDEIVQRLIDQNEMLMQKLAEQQPTEKIVEREVASSGVNDETITKLMDKILELSANQPQQQVQVIEKEVPVEKIVEKVVEVPVEVEKIVEKEVVKEVPVEKIVEKEVKVVAPAKPKKEAAPRLTLDEAYAQMPKQQQKYFDGLRQYALSKPNSKEKKATYAITIGQSTVNPLLKLTIKKDMTVALFKMEDEYLKDIKRDASGDGTKIKVKETEVVISDAQACKAAKNMIDLREDQIERYNDLLKEQRSMSKQRK